MMDFHNLSNKLHSIQQLTQQQKTSKTIIRIEKTLAINITITTTVTSVTTATDSNVTNVINVTNDNAKNTTTNILIFYIMKTKIN